MQFVLTVVKYNGLGRWLPSH